MVEINSSLAQRGINFVRHVSVCVLGGGGGGGEGGRVEERGCVVQISSISLQNISRLRGGGGGRGGGASPANPALLLHFQFLFFQT